MSDQETIPPIDGIEQLASAPTGSKEFTEAFYRDETTLLVKMAKDLQPRTAYCIAPAVGWPKRIYRLPA